MSLRGGGERKQVFPPGAQTKTATGKADVVVVNTRRWRRSSGWTWTWGPQATERGPAFQAVQKSELQMPFRPRFRPFRPCHPILPVGPAAPDVFVLCV